MRKWIFIVLPTVLLLALVVGDQAAKAWAEGRLAERAAAYYPPGSGSSATIHVADVKLDRDELFRGTVHVRDAGKGTIVATLDGPALAKAIGADVRFAPGEVEVHQRIQGVDVRAKGKLTVKGNVVTVTPTSVEGLSVPASRFAVSYRIPGIELMPCQAAVKVVQNGVVLSCDTVDIPAALIQAAQTRK